MAEISAALVKELRERTGAGMMDCKRALQETNGDIEAAIVLLREKGMAQRRQACRPRDDRGPRRLPARRRRLGARSSPSAARPSRSRRTTSSRRSRRRCSTRSTTDGVDATSALEEERVELAAKLGENIVVAGAARFEAVDGGLVAAYVHPPANKIGVLVQLRGGDAELGAQGRDAHLRGARSGSTATTFPPRRSRPSARSTRNSDEVQSKPEQAREKIVDGMLGKRFFARRTSSSTRRGSTTPSKTVGAGADGGRRGGAGVRALLARRSDAR